MGWDQTNVAENELSFLLRLNGTTTEEIVLDYLKNREPKIVKVEPVDNLDDYMAPPLRKITLSNGDVYVQKLVRSISYDDEGTDYYEYRKEDEEVVVQQIYPEQESNNIPPPI